MRILIIGLVVLALSVAGISTYLIQNFSTPEALTEMEKKSRRVAYHTLVANFDLQPGDALTSENITWRAWPDESLSEHYITVDEESQREGRINQVLGSVVRRSIQAGEPILVSKIFKTDAPGFLAGVLDEGMRAISLKVNPNTGVSGFILPGDRVDILIVHNKGRKAVQQMLAERKKAEVANQQGGTTTPPAGEAKPEPLMVLETTTETIMENVLVLAVDQTLGKIEGQSMVARTLTLQLTPKQVEILMTARTLGQMNFSLRGLPSSRKANLAVASSGDADEIEMSTSPDGNETILGSSYTHDVDISPFISALASGALDKQNQEAKLKREKELNAAASMAEQSAQSIAEAEAGMATIKKRNEELTRQLSEQEQKASEAVAKPVIPAEPIKVTKPVVKKKKKATLVEIYRGGTAETEVIEFK